MARSTGCGSAAYGARPCPVRTHSRAGQAQSRAEVRSSGACQALCSCFLAGARAAAVCHDCVLCGLSTVRGPASLLHLTAQIRPDASSRPWCPAEPSRVLKKPFRVLCRLRGRLRAWFNPTNCGLTGAEALQAPFFKLTSEGASVSRLGRKIEAKGPAPAPGALDPAASVASTALGGLDQAHSLASAQGLGN